jgi:hypothetical protein
MGSACTKNCTCPLSTTPCTDKLIEDKLCGTFNLTSTATTPATLNLLSSQPTDASYCIYTDQGTNLTTDPAQVNVTATPLPTNPVSTITTENTGVSGSYNNVTDITLTLPAAVGGATIKGSYCIILHCCPTTCPSC